MWLSSPQLMSDNVVVGWMWSLCLAWWLTDQTDGATSMVSDIDIWLLQLVLWIWIIVARSRRLSQRRVRVQGSSGFVRLKGPKGGMSCHATDLSDYAKSSSSSSIHKSYSQQYTKRTKLLAVIIQKWSPGHLHWKWRLILSIGNTCM